jgi:hypothetical protein
MYWLPATLHPVSLGLACCLVSTDWSLDRDATNPPGPGYYALQHGLRGTPRQDHRVALHTTGSVPRGLGSPDALGPTCSWPLW